MLLASVDESSTDGACGDRSKGAEELLSLTDGVQLRPFEERDYPAIAALQRAIYADYATPEDEMRHDDAHRDTKCQHARFVAEAAGGMVVGSAEHDQWPGRYHPRKFLGSVGVHPAWEGRGVGRALWAKVEEALRPLDPLSVSCYVREQAERGRRFAEAQGFREERRTFPSDLGIAGFDPAPYDGLEERLEREHGVRILSVPQLANDPERDRKLHALAQHVRRDFPADIPANEEPFEQWEARRLRDPKLLLDGYLVAVTPGGEYIGYSNVATDSDAPERLWIQQTGTLREWRRRGVATALKVRGIAFARERGYSTLRTGNDSANAPMLALNERLGFVRGAAWLYMKKVSACYNAARSSFPSPPPGAQYDDGEGRSDAE